MALAISCIFGVPASAASTPLDEDEADEQGQHGGERGADEDEPLATVQREVLVAAFGSDH